MNDPASGLSQTRRDFVIVDVFTQTPFGGNPLAVLPAAAGLSDALMQRIAREFNFAETTFVIRGGPAPQADRIRIFTPTRELPFAGHPTVGTAAVMSFLGLAAAADPDGLVVYQEGIGPVSVRVSVPQGRRVFAELVLEAALERPAVEPDRHDVAAGLSIAAGDIVDTWFAAVGVRFCFVHLRSPGAVDAAVLDRQAWASALAHSWAPQLFVFSGDVSSGGAVYARMFAPAFGIDEDPATGSASLALVGTLAERMPAGGAAVGLTITQGVAMGRPSSMQALAEKRSGRLLRMQVGGPSVIVARGTIDTED